LRDQRVTRGLRHTLVIFRCFAAHPEEALELILRRALRLCNRGARNQVKLEIAHKSIQRVYLLQNWVEAQSYRAVLFAKTANAIGLLPEKRDTGNLQIG
jgi:hypothetical protein